jgi:NAD(P)-dependent dehydrogenase (short-subunit alcohol dehydrogenase family)
MRGIQGHGYVVTGAASGIGLGTCKRLVSAGGSVAMLDRDMDKLTAEAAKLGSDKVALPIYCDVGDEASVHEAINTAAARLDSVRGLATSAAVFDPGDLVDLDELDMAVFDRVINVNLRGTALVIRAVLPLLPSGSAIVTVASVAGLVGHGFGTAYTASKGGVIALTRRIALRYGPSGIRANCLCPGATASEGMGIGFLDEKAATKASATLPLRRIGQPDEIGATVAMLLSDETSYMTGQVVAVDGGAVIR